MRRRGPVTVTVGIRNRGTGTAERVKVCLRPAPGSFRARHLNVMKNCRSAGSLKAGAARTMKFKVKAKRSLRGKGKLPLRLTSTANNTSLLAKTIRLGVKK